MTREEEEVLQAAENYAASVCKDCAERFYCKERIRKCAEYREQVNVFADAVKWADEHPKSPWISTKEKLPYNDSNFIHFGFTNRVLVRNKNGDLFVAYMKKNKDNEWIWCNDTDDNFDLLSCVTHWMPIPNLPEE